ncbi:MAG: hypothetical protein Q4F60_03455 [Candidatus Saccharibacteria bacterium]|nr:hypothetical protein [Candidatus Saccharibacteria bacterium]
MKKSRMARESGDRKAAAQDARRRKKGDDSPSGCVQIRGSGFCPLGCQDGIVVRR